MTSFFSLAARASLMAGPLGVACGVGSGASITARRATRDDLGLALESCRNIKG